MPRKPPTANRPPQSPAQPSPKAAKAPVGAVSYPHVALAEQYVSDVLDGVLPANKWVKLACQRYRQDRGREDDPAYPYKLDPDKAQKVSRFIELLPHTRGIWAGRKETLRLEPWQAWLIVTVFGTVRKKDGLRRFRNAMMLIPRKNGKSFVSSGVALYMFACDGEHSAEVFCGATSEKQAWEVFRASKLMAQGTPALCKHYGIAVNASNLNILANGSRFEPVIGKPGDGASPSLAILDEFHEHDTPDLRDTMVTGMGARSQPLLWTITTAGDNLAGPCFDDVLTGRAVLEGTIKDDRRFYVEWGIDDGDDWTKPEALYKANPNLGVSVSEEFLLEQQASAVRNTREQGRFQCKHLNVWVNAKSAFFNMQSWNACYDPDLNLDDLRGQTCVIGCDLAAEQDIAAVQLLFPRPNGKFVTFGRYYLPEDIIQNPNNKHYQGWLNSGSIIETEGNMTDLNKIQDDILDMMEKYNVREIVFDKFQGAQMMATLQNEGANVITMGQGAYDMHHPMHYLAALIDSNKIIHRDGPSSPMSWMMSNVVIRGGFDLNKPTKERKELKIDGPVSLVMCFARCMTPEQSTKSVYEERGLLILG